MSETEHELHIKCIEDEGTPDFYISCPAENAQQLCPIAEQHNTDFQGCLVQYELEQVGREIIRGSSEGQGPWVVKLTYEGYGEDAEGWIDLV